VLLSDFWRAEIYWFVFAAPKGTFWFNSTFAKDLRSKMKIVSLSFQTLMSRLGWGIGSSSTENK
jgi:hypothetical protein